MKIAAAALLVLSVAQPCAADVRVTPLVREGRARVKPHGSLIVWPWDSGLMSTNVNFTFIP